MSWEFDLVFSGSVPRRANITALMGKEILAGQSEKNLSTEEQRGPVAECLCTLHRNTHLEVTQGHFSLWWVHTGSDMDMLSPIYIRKVSASDEDSEMAFGKSCWVAASVRQPAHMSSNQPSAAATWCRRVWQQMKSDGPTCANDLRHRKAVKVNAFPESRGERSKSRLLS